MTAVDAPDTRPLAEALCAFFALPVPNEHEAFMGATVDHLYADCPTLARTGAEPIRCSTTVDPLGGDICGLCVRRWKQRQAVTP